MKIEFCHSSSTCFNMLSCFNLRDPWSNQAINQGSVLKVTNHQLFVPPQDGAVKKNILASMPFHSQRQLCTLVPWAHTCCFYVHRFKDWLNVMIIIDNVSSHFEKQQDAILSSSTYLQRIYFRWVVFSEFTETIILQWLQLRMCFRWWRRESASKSIQVAHTCPTHTCFRSITHVANTRHVFTPAVLPTHSRGTVESLMWRPQGI